MMETKYNTDMVICYNSRNRYKIAFNNKKKVVELYDLENKSVWERFDKFEYENKSKQEIINESKELIEIWKNEPIDDIHHITELN